MVRMVKPPDGTAWPLYCERAALVHFPIFKNGHSSVSDWLKGRDFGFETFIRPELPDGVTGFALLRHPFDRYISAMAQMWRMGLVADVPWRQFVNGVEAFNRRTATPWTARGDRHFLPQSNVVARMPKRRKLFLLDEPRVWQGWLRDEFGLSSSVRLDRQKETKVAMVAYARETLTEAIVLREYADDVSLWDSLL